LLLYGYVYYVIGFFFTLFVTLTVIKFLFFNALNYKKFLLFIFVNFFTFLTLLVLSVLYYSLNMSMDYFHTNTLVVWDFEFWAVFDTQTVPSYWGNLSSNYLLHLNNLNISLISIYTFPFVYIFIFITVLSLLFCLAYNVNEVNSFSLYILIILTAGYVLFFTDSLVLFFFQLWSFTYPFVFYFI